MTTYVKEVKIISKVCEDAGHTCDHPQKIVNLWRRCVETASWFDPEKEFVASFNLNTRLQVKNWQLVSVGTINETAVTPREAFRAAVATLAYSIIVVHNHPSGNPSPSPADLNFTRKMRDAGQVLDIKLQDHIIIGDGRNGNLPFYSFREAGYI